MAWALRVQIRRVPWSLQRCDAVPLQGFGATWLRSVLGAGLCLALHCTPFKDL